MGTKKSGKRAVRVSDLDKLLSTTGEKVYFVAFMVVSWLTTEMLMGWVFPDDRIEGKWTILIAAILSEIYLLVSLFRRQYKRVSFWLWLTILIALQSIACALVVARFNRLRGMGATAIIFIGFIAVSTLLEFLLRVDVDDPSAI